MREMDRQGKGGVDHHTSSKPHNNIHCTVVVLLC